MGNVEIIENLKSLYAEWLLIPNSDEYLQLIKQAINRLERENNN